MANILLTDGSTYQVKSIDGDPLFVAGSDHAHSEAFFRHSVEISGSHRTNQTGRLTMNPSDSNYGLYMVCGAGTGNDSGLEGPTVPIYVNTRKTSYTNYGLHIHNSSTGGSGGNTNGSDSPQAVIKTSIASGSTNKNWTFGIQANNNQGTGGWFMFSDHSSVHYYGTAEFAIDSNGNIHADGSLTEGSSTISDRRLKTNIEPITGSLASICQLNPKTFTWRHKTKDDVGLIAQEVEPIFPKIISEHTGSIGPKAVYMNEHPDEFPDKKYYSVNYEKLVPYLIDSIKELKVEIDTLKSKLGE